MSKIRLEAFGRFGDADDHPEAAGKHLGDALVLREAKRWDGAAYLAGYVVECSLKCLVIIEHNGNVGLAQAGAQARGLGHDLNALSQEALRLAALPGARTARYVPRMTSGHSMYDASRGWRETLRYREPGAVAPADADCWVAEAKAVFESTVVPMRIDGVV
jgi:HEPN domain-containing protein